MFRFAPCSTNILNNFGSAFFCSVDERSNTINILRINIRTVFYQLRYDLGMAFERCKLKRSFLFSISPIHVYTKR